MNQQTANPSFTNNSAARNVSPSYDECADEKGLLAVEQPWNYKVQARLRK